MLRCKVFRILKLMLRVDTRGSARPVYSRHKGRTQVSLLARNKRFPETFLILTLGQGVTFLGNVSFAKPN